MAAAKCIITSQINRYEFFFIIIAIYLTSPQRSMRWYNVSS